MEEKLDVIEEGSNDQSKRCQDGLQSIIQKAQQYQCYQSEVFDSFIYYRFDPRFLEQLAVDAPLLFIEWIKKYYCIELNQKYPRLILKDYHFSNAVSILRYLAIKGKLSDDFSELVSFSFSNNYFLSWYDTKYLIKNAKLATEHKIVDIGVTDYKVLSWFIKEKPESIYCHRLEVFKEKMVSVKYDELICSQIVSFPSAFFS